MVTLRLSPRLRRAARERLDRVAVRLAASRADGPLALLGLATGVAAGLLIVLFRSTIALLQQGVMPALPGEAFEGLPPALRFTLPLAAALAFGAAYRWLAEGARAVGVIHVLERLHYHQGHLPLSNLLVQFLGGALALASGQSVGREGPSVHIGAAAGSQIGKRLGLPNNSVRTLVACGAAAAIAASFNTPLAGVVFAMEVVMAEYTIAGFVPVILAAVAATTITQGVFGSGRLIAAPLFTLGSAWELIHVAVMGVVLGLLSAAFVSAVHRATRLARQLPLIARFALAGLVVGALGVPRPEILGLGYDTVAERLAGELTFGVTLAILAAKLAASAVCTAVRMPGGVIGPTVVMGCLAGGCFADGVGLLPAASSPPDLYAVLGMGAFMGAVLQAPLAALLALLESTGNPLITMPAMLAVVTATLTARVVCRQESVFTLMLRDDGLDYRHDPVSQGLRRIGVAAVMNASVVHAERTLDSARARALLAGGPQWIIVEDRVKRPLLVRAADVARYCASAEAAGGEVDLVSIPAERHELAPVHLQASLYEARQIMAEQGVEALYVRRPVAPMSYRTFGIVRRQDIESGYVLRA